MRQLIDTVWQRRGTSWLWDEEALNHVCRASEAWSLRQFIQAAGKWPEQLPSNNGVTLVVAGLEGCLDLLSPDEAEIWLDEAVKSTILSFQDEYAGEASLIFWMPSAHGRLKVQPTTDSVTWVCGAPNQERQIDFGRILWGEANEYPQEILLAQSAKPAGLFHLRIT